MKTIVGIWKADPCKMPQGYEFGTWAKAICVLHDMPVVSPVAHSRWRYSGVLQECQSCGEIYSRYGGNAGKLWSFCPNCGKMMDLEEVTTDEMPVY